MKTLLISTLAAAAILATATTGALAYGKNGTCEMSDKQQYSKHSEKQVGKMQGYRMHKGKSLMHMFAQLNLSDEQHKKMQTVMQEQHKKRGSMYDAFSKEGFDKQKFIEQSLQKRENMLKLKADTIEKAYNILTKEQKNQLRVLMDLQETKGMKFDKYCNGRG